MTNERSKSTLYFGYGSNLWQHQMQQRCSTSRYLGLARLPKYRWIINSRGYANVVEVDTEKQSGSMDEVWGLVYSLQREDERKLDVNEGVPIAYTKEELEVDCWWAHGEKRPDRNGKAEQAKMLVYIDRKRTVADKPKEEYVYRMNKGIEDAVREGMPKEYVEKVMRKFIPERTHGDDVERVAREQAESFEDQR